MLLAKLFIEEGLCLPSDGVLRGDIQLLHTLHEKGAVGQPTKNSGVISRDIW